MKHATKDRTRRRAVKPQRPDPKRGRHRKRRSPETRAFEATQLVPPCPPWMEPATWRKLAAMREQP